MRLGKGLGIRKQRLGKTDKKETRKLRKTFRLKGNRTFDRENVLCGHLNRMLKYVAYSCSALREETLI